MGTCASTPYQNVVDGANVGLLNRSNGKDGDIITDDGMRLSSFSIPTTTSKSMNNSKPTTFDLATLEEVQQLNDGSEKPKKKKKKGKKNAKSSKKKRDLSKKKKGRKTKKKTNSKSTSPSTDDAGDNAIPLDTTATEKTDEDNALFNDEPTKVQEEDKDKRSVTSTSICGFDLEEWEDGESSSSGEEEDDEYLEVFDDVKKMRRNDIDDDFNKSIGSARSYVCDDDEDLDPSLRRSNLSLVDDGFSSSDLDDALREEDEEEDDKVNFEVGYRVDEAKIAENDISSSSKTRRGDGNDEKEEEAEDEEEVDYDLQPTQPLHPENGDGSSYNSCDSEEEHLVFEVFSDRNHGDDADDESTSSTCDESLSTSSSSPSLDKREIGNQARKATNDDIQEKRELLKKKIFKDNTILENLEEEDSKGTKEYRAYVRKQEQYMQQLSNLSSKDNEDEEDEVSNADAVDEHFTDDDSDRSNSSHSDNRESEGEDSESQSDNSYGNDASCENLEEPPSPQTQGATSECKVERNIGSYVQHQPSSSLQPKKSNCTIVRNFGVYTAPSSAAWKSVF